MPNSASCFRIYPCNDSNVGAARRKLPKTVLILSYMKINKMRASPADLDSTVLCICQMPDAVGTSRISKVPICNQARRQCGPVIGNQTLLYHPYPARSQPMMDAAVPLAECRKEQQPPTPPFRRSSCLGLGLVGVKSFLYATT